MFVRILKRLSGSQCILVSAQICWQNALVRIGQEASLSNRTCFLVVLLVYGLLYSVVSSFKLLNLSLNVGIVLGSASSSCIVRWLSYNRDPTALVYATRVVKGQFSPDSVGLAHILMLAVNLFASWWQLLLLSLLLLTKGRVHIIHSFRRGLIACPPSLNAPIASHFVLVDVDVRHFLSSCILGRFRLCPVAQIFCMMLVDRGFHGLRHQLVRSFDIILLLEFFRVFFRSLIYM